MDVSKFKKLIERVVAKEIKKQLPKALDEAIKRNADKMVTEVEAPDPFKLANAVLEESRDDHGYATAMEGMEFTEPTPQKQFTSNPVINQLLNETTPFSQSNRATPITESTDKTVAFDTNIAEAGLDGLRSTMATKMGYGDIGGNKPNPNGLGVETGIPELDKALNRDYSDLVNAMDKKK